MERTPRSLGEELREQFEGDVALACHAFRMRGSRVPFDDVQMVYLPPTADRTPWLGVEEDADEAVTDYCIAVALGHAALGHRTLPAYVYRTATGPPTGAAAEAREAAEFAVAFLGLAGDEARQRGNEEQ